MTLAESKRETHTGSSFNCRTCAELREKPQIPSAFHLDQNVTPEVTESVQLEPRRPRENAGGSGANRTRSGDPQVRKRRRHGEQG
jgi:hypothetical protein